MRIEKSIVVERPVKIVYAFVTDISNITLWTLVKEVKQLTGGPMRIGASFILMGDFMGRFELPAEVTAYEPYHTLALKIAPGLASSESQFSLAFAFAPANEGTSVTVVGEGETGKLFKLAGPLVASIAKKQMEVQLKRLKSLLESNVEGQSL